MITVRKRGVTALTAAAALAIGVIPAAFTTSSILASGEEPTTLDASSYASAGTLALSTTAGAGTVTWSESDTLTQGFTAGLHCEILDDPDSDDLLQISGSVGEESVGQAGFKNGSIGVFEYEEANSSQCFRVDPGSFTTQELLSLELGTDLEDFFGRLKADSTSLRLMKQQSGDLTVTASFFNGDDTTPLVRELVSPKRDKSGTILTLAPTFPTGFIFDRVTLRAAGGAFSLVGPSTFSLVSEAEYLMSCREGQNSITEQTGTSSETTITYTGNADDSDCTKGFGVKLDTEDASEFTFLKSPTVAPTAEFVIQRMWSIGIPEGDAQVPATLVDFTNTPGAAGDVSIGWCSGATYDGDTLTGIDWIPSESDDLDDSVDGVQYACVGTQSAKAINGQLEVSEQIYLFGDVIMRKP